MNSIQKENVNETKRERESEKGKGIHALQMDRKTGWEGAKQIVKKISKNK